MIVLVGLIATLYGFCKERNELRNLERIEIEFLDESSPFIDLNTVNKLLIQNKDSITSVGKETLVLNKMESRLLANPMIKNVDVFVSIDGTLGVNIEQRKPIARISGSPDFYLDEDAKEMPLSKVHTARVPLITGTREVDYGGIRDLILKVNEDEFMRKSVVGFHLESNGDIKMKLRKYKFTVLFGQAKDIEKKFQKLKAFYKKAKQDALLTEYRLVNLKFKDQVVATKY